MGGAMRSIADIHRELGCGRNTLYPIIEAAEVEPVLEGLAKMFTDEQFQKIQEVYYRKYPNRKPKEIVREQSTLFKIDSDDQSVEVISSKEMYRSIQEIQKNDKKLFQMIRERDAETIADLRKQVEGQKDIISQLLALLQNQNSAVPKQVTTTSTQRTSPMFPEHDPNVDTLTGDLFETEAEKAMRPAFGITKEDAQNPRAPEIPRGTYEVIRQHVKPPSWQPSAFPDDMVPIDADEAVLQFFKGRIPQRTTDFDGLMAHMERVGFPQVSTGALSSRITKLRKQQQAERKARDQLTKV
jgi:hypothetical protein